MDLLLASKRRRPGLLMPGSGGVPVVSVVTVDGAHYPSTSLSCGSFAGTPSAWFVPVPASIHLSVSAKVHLSETISGLRRMRRQLGSRPAESRTAADLAALSANARGDGPAGVRSCTMPPTVQRYDHHVRPLAGHWFWAVPQTDWATLSAQAPADVVARTGSGCRRSGATGRHRWPPAEDVGNDGVCMSSWPAGSVLHRSASTAPENRPDPKGRACPTPVS